MIPLWLRMAARLGRIGGLTDRRPAILVVKLDSLGDLLLFTGALRKLREHFPHYRIVLAIDAAGFGLVERLHAVDEIIGLRLEELGRRRPLAVFRRLLAGRKLFRQPYRMVLHSAYTTHAVAHQICAAVRADEKIWYEGADEIRPAMEASWGDIYSRRVRVPGAMHELDKTVALLRGIGMEGLSREDIRPVIALSEIEEHDADQAIRAWRCQYPGARLVALCPGARFPQKDWGVLRFAELLRELAVVQRPPAAKQEEQAVGLVVLVLGGREDRTKGEQIRRLTQDTPGLLTINRAGTLALRQSMAVLARCDVCVGNDTFGLHAAIVVGTPSVVIMGGGDAGRWTPWGDTVRHRMVSQGMECYGCGWQCRYAEPRCLAAIQVERVHKEVGDLLDRKRPG